jgi:tetratricopeptide (TPR) repeat protein
VVDDVARALAGAASALEEGDTARALELLTWAKAVAPRSAVVRETLGIAAYHAGDFEQAHRELLAYRRMTDRHDQNHLLADSARALGRYDKVGEHVRDMAAARVPEDRLAEAYIVQAGAWSDLGDLRGALGVLERLDLDPDEVRPWHPRVWYAAADLCERMGDHDRARDYFEAITTVTDEFLDVEERLAALEG